MKLSTIKSESVTPNSFIGCFKAHNVNVSRSHSGAPWNFLVTSKSGNLVSSGVLPGVLQMRDAVHKALNEAGLVSKKPSA